MKFSIVAALFVALVLSSLARPLDAATRKVDGLHAGKATPLATDDVVAKPDKPKKTKKNPSDNDPDDGDNGHGNDDKDKPPHGGGHD